MSDVPPRCSPLSSTAGSSLSVEMERDQYREKVEHFKILIRKLQEENQTYKLRKESTETVSRLLQEAKQEVVALQNKLGVSNSVIRVLVSRLESNGLSGDVFPQEGEDYIPGQSQNLLDNLTRENKRLRSIIRSRSGDPEEFAKLQQRNEELERDCSELRIFNSNQQTRIAELELVLRSSDNEKDRAINELTEKFNHVTRELSSRDTLCTSLAEETRMLQSQLEDVARQCQELAKRLQEQGHNTDKIVQKVLKSSPQDVKEITDTSKSLADENKNLKQKVKEITDMNKRWQDYNNQREAYVKTLLAEVANHKKRAEEAQANTVPHETQVEMNKILDESRRLMRELDNLQKIASDAVKERDMYKQNLDRANSQLNAQRTENQQLQRNLQGARNQESSEIINALKAQIRICTEDFESERADRQRAHEKLNRQKQETERLRKEVESLKREIVRYQSGAMVQTQGQTQYNDPFYHYQTPGPQGTLSNEGLAARGSSQLPAGPQRNIDKYNVIDRYNVVDGADTHFDGEIHVIRFNQLEDKQQNDLIDEVKNMDDDRYVSLNASSISSKDNMSSSSRASPRNSSRDSSPVMEYPVEYSSLRNSSGTKNIPVPVTTKSDDVLRCPNCNKSFTSDEHPELLEHMESCVD